MVAADARWSNGMGDVALGCVHVAVTVQSVRLAARHWVRRDATQRQLWLSIVVPLYFATLAGFQLMGASYHLCAPKPTTLDASWLAYLALGGISPCLYGVVLSLQTFESCVAAAIAATLWVCGALGYITLAAMQLDFATFLPWLPKTLNVRVPADAARRLASMPWMASALRFNRQRRAGEADLWLRFDGRGYAATPFDRAFDKEFATAFELIAPFPCWLSHSVSFLMLCVGVICNTFHFLICRHGGTSYVGHILLTLALLTMPVVMVFGGVATGIDWMHGAAAPVLYLQATRCLRLLDPPETPPPGAPAAPPTAPKKSPSIKQLHQESPHRRSGPSVRQHRDPFGLTELFNTWFDSPTLLFKPKTQ